MSRPHDSDRNQDATCYIGNLDDRAHDSLVWELMVQAGPLVNVHLPKDRITGAHQGYAFAEYQTENDAEYACRIMNGIKLYGKPLRVNKASSDRKQIDIGANLFVGNLDANVDERTLYDAFSAFGAVVGLPKVARDPVTNASKSYGFVSFDSFEAADAAIESLHNQFLLNRPITVSYALKKDGKGGERHGTPAERLLAAQARKNNALPPRAAPPAFFGPPPGVAAAAAGGGAPGGGGPANGGLVNGGMGAGRSPMPPPPPPPLGAMGVAPPVGMAGASGAPSVPPVSWAGGGAVSGAGGMMAPPAVPVSQPGYMGAAGGGAGYMGPPPPMMMAPPPPRAPHQQAPTSAAAGYGAPPPHQLTGGMMGGYGAGAPPAPPPSFMTGSNNAPLGPRR